MSSHSETSPNVPVVDHSHGSLPAVSLPKGGGAIRGIGEKFAANPVTGSGSTTVPIVTSPGRVGFGPQLSLAYDSGAGNGPFGFGWSLSLPSITRKTDKGLPKYNDAEDSDVFILSGTEDLVPVYRKDAAGEWAIDTEGNLVVQEDEIDGFRVRRYRPRIEGLFARIERWTRIGEAADVHWRSISKDNILTLYGSRDESRIADPDDASRIFSWLICETRDDKGNAIIYRYKREDGTGVDLTQAHERNRGDRQDSRRRANRYLKRIFYGNRVSLLDNSGRRPRSLTQSQIDSAGWMFEVVFDYGDHDLDSPRPNDDEVEQAGILEHPWPLRQDSFSTYRAGFEIRTARRCERVLMFHHFDGEEGVGRDCVVRSTDFTYSAEQDPSSALNAVYSFLRSVVQTGYRRTGSTYQKRSLPPLEFEYTQAVVQDTVHEVKADSLENLPIGADGSYQWTDLHGEGIPGILTEQGGAWFYKRNLSPASEQSVELAPMEMVATKPNLSLVDGQAQFMDLAGDGLPDLVMLDGPAPGLFEHDEEEGWKPFRSFTSRLNRDTHDPNLRFVDLDGDGHADVLISEDHAFVWHESLGEQGFGPARAVPQALDEEKGPRLVFADGTQSIYLADLSGDGLADLARIRNGEICYWPNLGYGRFGAKVTMDNAPQFDTPDQFDHQRVRLADIDGSGTTDVLYLHGDGVRLYFNQSGNSWSQPRHPGVFPPMDNLSSIATTDLLGNGTACLVWSSPLPDNTRRSLRYVSLMGEEKPHLLVKTINNLGAETSVKYAPSLKFYLQDKRDDNPWITRLPFPVHVVERVETFDRISRNRFVTRYAYHHGYFDGEEREFRGFGMVEQWDTEVLSALNAGELAPVAINEDPSSHVPPVHTKTWFHTGINIGRGHVSDFFAGLLDADDVGEYYREPGLTDDQAARLGLDDQARRLYDDARARERLLADTLLPAGLTLEEEREACRALKGMMLHQEVYALDRTANERHPYIVLEQNFSIRLEQPRGASRQAVFFTHPREAITYHYERNPADPRIQHLLTLEVDDFGNVLQQAAVGYGRRQPDPLLPLPVDRDKQTETLITYTANRVTIHIDDTLVFPDDYRSPLTCETRTYHLTGFAPISGPRFQESDFLQIESVSEIDYQDPPSNGKQRRLIEHVRTLYRPDDLGSAQNDPLTLLPLGEIERLALPGESYRLSLTSGLADAVYVDSGKLAAGDVATVLSSAGGYVHSEGDANWWLPSGRTFYSDNPNHSAAEELAEARTHFFLPRRYRDPFHTNAVSTESLATYDAYDLLLVETRDALDNVVTARTQDDEGNTSLRLDYRVLQPYWLTDPNGNRARVAFDTLGMLVGTAVMGKPGENLGDSLDGFDVDLDELVLLDHVENPLDAPQAILQRATTRLVYDLFAYQRTSDQPEPQPAVVYTLARETHASDPLQPGGLKIQHSFSYSDGFGREIQKKLQAEPEKVAGVAGPTRWVGSGWMIFNNKGKPVRQYEPFFSATHRFEFAAQTGVSSILFYDPLERVVATLHPNHTWEKVVFDPWQQSTFDVNDTVLNNDGTTDPKQDQALSGFFSRLPDAEYLPTWYEQRIGLPANDPERIAAEKAAIHRQTPTVAYLDTLGRTFLTISHNRFTRNNSVIEETYLSRVDLDIEGNQRAVRDAIQQAGDAQGRIVMRYDYDMLGNRLHQASMEAGERWMLNDVTGKPVYAWDSRGHTFRTTYDPLRRPLRVFVTGAAVANPTDELLTERLVYGEQHPQSEMRNLRGKLFLHLDQAGSVTNDANDFKGNPLQISRRLTRGTQYRQTLNWQAIDNDHIALPDDSRTLLDLVALEAALAPPRLETDTYRSRTTYNALNRAVQVIPPRSSQAGPRRNIIQPRYNEANLLEGVDVWLDHSSDPGGLLDPSVVPSSLAGVRNIDYDAKGQRVLIEYKSQAITSYAYDPLTFRLTNLKTTRPAGSNGPSLLFADPSVQDLRYTYDPVGNITRIEDAALSTIVFNNEEIEPICEYEYDALYRLIEAHGREHIGQTAQDLNPPNDNNRDYPFAGLADFSIHPNDAQALRNYTERYEYDGVGNFTSMQHIANGGSWTRRYEYLETSLTEGTKRSNRLSRTRIGAGANPAESYLYDPHGNMTRMPHFGGTNPDPNMRWDYRDQLREINLGGGGTAYYVYDAAGQRMRKICERSANLSEERIYLGAFEIYRRRQNGQLLERETLHIMDDKQRIALVETRTVDEAGTDQAPAQLIRYQFGNHLGSSSLELDETAQIISYEEYTPYGSTAYQAVRSTTETPKRYRYTGKERDEETGFYYYGARYYVPWLARWTSCDAIDNLNRYEFVRGRPATDVDIGGLISNRQLMGLDDATVDAALQKDPSLSNVLTLAAKQTGYDLWNLATSGFVSKHDELVEARDEGTISDSDYWAKTTGEASKSLLVATVSAATGGAGGAAAKTLTSAVVQGTVRGAASGAVSGVVGDLTSQASDVALGNAESIDLSKTLESAQVGAVTGAVFGGVAGAGKFQSKTTPRERPTIRAKAKPTPPKDVKHRAIYNTKAANVDAITESGVIKPSPKSNRTFVEIYPENSPQLTAARARGVGATETLTGAKNPEVGIEFDLHPSELSPSSSATWPYVEGPINLEGRNVATFLRPKP